MPGPRADKTLDIKGLLDPRPAVLTATTLEDMKSGQVLCVVTDDLSARRSIPELCRGRGYEILDLQEDRGTLAFTIRK